MTIVRSYGSGERLEGVSSGTADGLDGYHSRAYWYCFMLGFGLLLPFNFVINLIPWLSSSYRWDDFGFYASLALTNPTLAVQFFLLPFGQHVPSGHRIRGSLCTGAAALIALALVATRTRPWVGLVAIAACGVAESVMEASLMALCARLPSGLYAQAYMAGVAAAGVASSALQLLLHVALGAGHTAGAGEVAAYVSGGVAVLCACVAIHAHLARLPPVVRLTGASDDCGCSICGMGCDGSRTRRRGGEGREDVAALLAPAATDLDSPPQRHARSVPGAAAAVSMPMPSEGASGSGEGGGGGGGAGLSAAPEKRHEDAEAAAISATDAAGTGLQPPTHPPPPAASAWRQRLHKLGRVAWGVACPAAAVFHNFVATFLVYPGVLSVIPQVMQVGIEATWPRGRRQ
jgi:hypothetical protein